MWIHNTERRDFRASADQEKNLERLSNKLRITKKTTLFFAFAYALRNNLPRKKLRNPKGIGQITTIKRERREIIALTILGKLQPKLSEVPDADTIMSIYEEYADAGLSALNKKIDFESEENYEVLLDTVLQL